MVNLIQRQVVRGTGFCTYPHLVGFSDGHKMKQEVDFDLLSFILALPSLALLRRALPSFATSFADASKVEEGFIGRCPPSFYFGGRSTPNGRKLKPFRKTQPYYVLKKQINLAHFLQKSFNKKDGNKSAYYTVQR
jgi:hypothetical protein